MLAAVLLSACELRSKEPRSAAARLSPEPSPPPALAPVGQATLRGRVWLHGELPALQVVAVESKPECAHLHVDAPLLWSPLAGSGGGLRDCFVHVKGMPGAKAVALTPHVTLTFQKCWLEPRVLGAQVGQDLEFANADPFQHHANTPGVPILSGALGSELGNQRVALRKESIPTTITCDIHPWERASLCVFSHPFWCLTDDDGSFEIRDLPPGKLTIAAWHEPFTRLVAPEPVEVELRAGETTSIDFVFTLEP